MNDLRRRSILCSLAFLLPLAAGAQTATLVRDINQEPRYTLEFGVEEMASVPGRVFFASNNSEMWTTDGTAAGTYQLKDACPGPCDSEPEILGSLREALLWVGWSDDLQPDLWRSDGTRAGTFRLVEEHIRVNEDSHDPVPVAALTGGALYFVSSNGIANTLWRTDGTRAGTRPLRTFEGDQHVDMVLADDGKVFLIVGRSDPFLWTWSIWTSDGTPQGTRSIQDLGHLEPAKPLVAGGRLFFVTSDHDAGDELWASDGTEAGTRQITDFAAPHPFNDSIDFFRTWVSGGRLFFAGDDVVHGEELYESDGTKAGTRRITDFGTAEPDFRQVANLGSRIVFDANDGLGHFGVWTTTGDPASTRFLELPCGEDCFYSERVSRFVKVGSRVVLLAQFPSGPDLLSIDGTPDGSRRLPHDCPQGCNVLLPGNLPTEASAIPFAVSSFSSPDTLWITDGTRSGTRQRATLRGASIDSHYSEISAGSFTLVLAGDQSATSLWALDQGKSELRLITAPGMDGPGAFVDHVTAHQDGVAFTAWGGYDTTALWRSAGAEQSTALAVPLPRPLSSWSNPACDTAVSSSNLASLGTRLVFLQEWGLGNALWGSDGTPEGTRQLTPDGLAVQSWLAVGIGRVYFKATLNHAVSLWTSDGTPAGTVQLASWPSLANSVRCLAAFGNEIYFGYEQQLWKSDGTPQGTREVADTGTPSSFARVGSNVYFVVHRPTSDEIWRSDGTAAGTQALGTIPGLDRDAYPRELIGHQGGLYFFAWVERDVRGLWRSDGTAAGTVLLARLPEMGNSAYPNGHQPTIAGGKLFFVAADEDHGQELWVTDGTPAGTRIVRDIRPGSGSAKPEHLTAAGGRLFFSAAEETYGRELWVSDGTEAGTRLVQDIAPFGASSEPDHLTAAGDRLYFVADDGIFGRELWSLPLAGSAGCQPASTRLCLNGGRYQVEASWRTDASAGRGTAVALSGDTGYFWFFDAANVEAVVKVLDGRSLNGHVWVFYGALSDVDYTITVTDTQTGATRRYHNSAGQLASVGDTKGFGPLGAYGAAPPTFEAAPSPPPLVAERLDPAAAVPCQASARRLCLNGNRFAVEVAWKDFEGQTGKGTAVPLTGDTGTFWFFSSANVELVVKALDGRPLNNKFWLFYGALSNVEYTLTVTDTETGTVRTYKNPSGRFASVADTSAF